MLFTLELRMATIARQCWVIPTLTKCTQIRNSLTRTVFSMLEFMCGDSDVNHKQSVRFVSTALSLFLNSGFDIQCRPARRFIIYLHCLFLFCGRIFHNSTVFLFWSACALWLCFKEIQVVKADQLIAHSLVLWFLSINGGSTWRNVL